MSQKSLTKNICIENALRSHRCRFNEKHIISKGDQRLRVKEGRNEFHYCIECARKFLQNDLEKLKRVLAQIS